MTETELKLAYVVPTKDRPDDMRKLLETLKAQTELPSQIVIVDGSDDPIRWLIDEYSSLPLTYVREYPPSLARQRNAGIAALSAEIALAGYLDDDLELDPAATQKMLAFWRTAPPDTGGAAFTIVNQPTRSRLGKLISNLFLLNGDAQGKVLRSGFATSILPRSQTAQTDWLYGGATIWRREVFETYHYDEWYIGHGYLEDLDYSHRVSKDWSLHVLADALCWHWPKPVLVERNFDLGRQQVLNRIYFVRKIGGFSRFAIAWAFAGQLVRNLLESLMTGDKGGYLRFKGNIRGLVELSTGGLRQVGGTWK